MDAACRELRESIVELVEGDLDEPRARPLRRHAALCDACAAELAAEEHLVAALRSLPRAPVVDLPVPDPIAAGPGSSVADAARVESSGASRWRLATASLLAAAAVMLAAVAVYRGVAVSRDSPGGDVAAGADAAGRSLAGSPMRPATSALVVDPTVRWAEIREIRSVPRAVSLPDDDLLALTAGADAVVMRRPVRGPGAGGR